MWEENDFSALDSCDAFCDTPVYSLYPDLARRCPGSFFIVTTREKQSWLNSMQWLLENGPKIWPWRDAYNSFHESYFGSAAFDTELYGLAFDRHHELLREWAVREHQKLLWLDLDKGYGFDEICEFLNKPKPVQPYPRGNARRSPLLDGLKQTAIRGINAVRRRVWNANG